MTEEEKRRGEAKWRANRIIDETIQACRLSANDREWLRARLVTELEEIVATNAQTKGICD